MITTIHSIHEQGGKHMINGREKQEGPGRNMDAEREELQQATKRFIRSVFRTGVSVAFLPINSIPRKPQQHFYAAGREFTHVLTTLIHELVARILLMAKETNPVTP